MRLAGSLVRIRVQRNGNNRINDGCHSSSRPDIINIRIRIPKLCFLSVVQHMARHGFIVSIRLLNVPSLTANSNPSFSFPNKIVFPFGTPKHNFCSNPTRFFPIRLLNKKIFIIINIFFCLI